MPDDKRGREKQARDADRRQRERDIHVRLERWDETEPPVEAAALDDFETELAAFSFPRTGAELVEAVGEREVESPEGTERVADVLPETDTETFDSPAAVRARVQRPTVGAAMKAILEAGAELRHDPLDDSKRTAYEKTLRALKAIDADDEDEGVAVIRDWVVEQIRDRERLPDSRAVRREAAEFCRANGYEVRKNDWLGV